MMVYLLHVVCVSLDGEKITSCLLELLFLNVTLLTVFKCYVTGSLKVRLKLLKSFKKKEVCAN